MFFFYLPSFSCCCQCLRSYKLPLSFMSSFSSPWPRWRRGRAPSWRRSSGPSTLLLVHTDQQREVIFFRLYCTNWMRVINLWPEFSIPNSHLWDAHHPPQSHLVLLHGCRHIFQRSGLKWLKSKQKRTTWPTCSRLGSLQKSKPLRNQSGDKEHWKLNCWNIHHLHQPGQGIIRKF